MNLYSEEQHFLAVQEKNILHEEKVTDVTADHANPPTPQDGTTSSCTKCWLSIAKERHLP